jgi:hypothetical protein
MTRLALAVAAILTWRVRAQSRRKAAARSGAAYGPAARNASAYSAAAEAPSPAAQQPTAQQPGGGLRGSRRWYFACRPEAAQFCGQVRPGGGRIRLCLLHRYYKLPQGCRQALIQGRQQ